jgi:hypothetical protein
VREQCFHRVVWIGQICFDPGKMGKVPLDRDLDLPLAIEVSPAAARTSQPSGSSEMAVTTGKPANF